MAEKDEKITLQDVLGAILTNNVNLDDTKYAKMLDDVAKNYEANQQEKDPHYNPPTLAERRERIKANYYGSSINFLFQILNTVNDFYRNYAPLIEAIAEKVGVEFEKVKTDEDKAMEAVARYMNEKAEKEKAEKELIEKQNLNRQARRKVKKETGEVIKFERKDK